MIPLDEAIGRVRARCEPVGARRLPLAAALGCVTAEEVVAEEPVPPFANSALDGYAVRAADVGGAGESEPVRLDVVATLAAGAPPKEAVGAGQAIRIMTGAPMPPGADAIVMVELTRRAVGDADVVEVLATVEPGTGIRGVGEDVRTGDVVLAGSTVLGPAHLGVLASVGRTEVEVVPRLRVGVLSTGDELVQGGGPLRPGQIRESNRPMLLALVARAGCEAVDLGLVPDDETVLEDVLRRGAVECDALVSSGGVSMGDFDVVKAVLDRMADMDWMQIAIKPAKPFAFGSVAGTPVFGLPGNPVSSLVSFELLARPALRRMMGHPTPDRPRIVALTDRGLTRRLDGKDHYQRVQLRWANGNFHADAVWAQGSHQLAASASANGLAVLPDGMGVPAGGAVEVLWFDDLPLSTS